MLLKDFSFQLPEEIKIYVCIGNDDAIQITAIIYWWMREIEIRNLYLVERKKKLNTVGIPNEDERKNCYTHNRIEMDTRT